MNKKMAKKVKKICIILLIISIILPTSSPFFGQVLATKAGHMIIIPEDLPQYPAMHEMEDIPNWNPSSRQFKVNKTWKEQGKPTEQSVQPMNCAYLTLAGEKRYLIALTTTFGEAGDYIDVYLKDGTVFKAVMGDAKGNQEGDKPYLYKGIFVGHTYEGNKCDILEFVLKDYSMVPSGDYNGKFANIEKIYNGGSYFDHPEGPVEPTSTYVIGGGTTSSTTFSNIKRAVKKKTETFGSVIISFLRSLATMGYTFIDNFVSGREDVDNMYYLVDPDAQQNNQQNDQQNDFIPDTTVWNTNIIETCKQLTTYLMNKHVHYGNRSYKDIEQCLHHPDGDVVCATYVTLVLWKSGALTTSQANKYNYHWTGDMPRMLREFGWVKIPPKEAQAGDVILHNPGPDGHAAIYAGDGKIWDEYTAVIEGTHYPTGQTNPYNISDCQVWRKQ